MSHEAERYQKGLRLLKSEPDHEYQNQTTHHEFIEETVLVWATSGDRGVRARPFAIHVGPPN